MVNVLTNVIYDVGSSMGRRKDPAMFPLCQRHQVRYVFFFSSFSMFFRFSWSSNRVVPSDYHWEHFKQFFFYNLEYFLLSDFVSKITLQRSQWNRWKWTRAVCIHDGHDKKHYGPPRQIRREARKERNECLATIVTILTRQSAILVNSKIVWRQLFTIENPMTSGEQTTGDGE